MIGGSVDLCDRDGVTLTIVPPLAASTTPPAHPETHSVNEDAYAARSGFATGTNVDVYVVPDQDWNDGDPIPTDVTGAVETAAPVNGKTGPVLVWHARLVPRRYDIMIDANRNGVYDANHRWAG